jgi:phosphoserine phosphatase
VHLQTADDLWERISAVIGELPGGVIATDGDGTLWGGDVGEDMFHAFLDQGRVEAPALDALRRTARDHDLSDAGTGPEIARRIYAAHAAGAYPEERLCELMTWCFAGWTRSEVAAFARAVVDRGNLESRLHGEVHAVLARARAAGVETFLVSASPFAVVVEAGRRVGFSEAQIVAALPAYEGQGHGQRQRQGEDEGEGDGEGDDDGDSGRAGEADRMLADVERPIPYGPGKVSRLRERIGEGRLLYASFGDNAFDVDLLRASRLPAAVRPKPRLRARAAEVAGLVELAPAPVSAVPLPPAPPAPPGQEARR